MSSEEFTPKPKGRPKGSKNKPKDGVIIKKTASVGITGTPGLSLPPETNKTPEAATKPDKLALAADRRKRNKDAFRKSGALEGQKLVAPQRPGFYRYWANDHKGKLDRMLDRGYTFVEDGAANAPFETTSTKSGSKTSQRVDYADGQPMHAYLMEIPEEFHKQDQQDKEALNIEAAEAVRKGSALGSEAYVPKGASQYELE